MRAAPVLSDALTQLVSLSHRDTLIEDGAVLVRNVLTPAEINGLRDALDRLYAEFTAGGAGIDLDAFAREVWAPGSAGLSGPSAFGDFNAARRAIRADPAARPLRDPVPAGNAGAYFFTKNTWLATPAIRAVALDSQLPELLADMLDTTRLHFWNDLTHYRLPHTAQRTAFHQDLPYMQADGRKAAAAWINLDPPGPGAASPQFVRGSNRWNKVFAANSVVAQTPLPGSTLPRLPDIEGEISDFEIISFDTQPGDVIIYDARTVMGCPGNPGAQLQRSLSLHYCGDDMVYCRRPGRLRALLEYAGEEGQEIGDRMHPVVWPRPWPQLLLSSLYG